MDWICRNCGILNEDYDTECSTCGEYNYENEDEICGYTYDHDSYTTYEDDDGLQWMCRRCGAEGWEDFDE